MDTEYKKYAVGWDRVSTKEQDEEGYSLAAQLKLTRSYTDKNNLKLGKEFIVPESASSKQERKLFNEMFQYLKQNPKIKDFVCEKVDRITRNLKDAVRFDEWLEEDGERRIHLVKDGLVMHRGSRSQDKLNWGIKVLFAKNVSDNLSEEVIKGLTEKAEEGWYPGNQKRGYKTTGETGKRTWILDESQESEAPYIRRAFELYDTGEYSVVSLGEKLFSESWKSYAGTPVSGAEIHKLLTDCFFCGEFKWKGKHYTNANHTPLIPKELFYRVQDRLNRKLTGKYKKHDFTYKGLTCGECGRSVVGDLRKGHNYYHCTRHANNCTQRQYTREEDVESQILELLVGFKAKQKHARLVDWVRKALKEHHTEKADYQNKILADLSRQYELLQNRLDNLYVDKLDGKVTIEFYNRMFDQWTHDQKLVIEALEKQRRVNVDYMKLGQNIFELSQKAAELFNNRKKADDKRALLGFIFSNLKLKDKKLIPVYKKHFAPIPDRAGKGDWLGWKDSNLRMGASKAPALPLGYTPTK